MEERVHERYLKINLLSTKCGGGGQGRDLIESAPKLLCGFSQRRASERLLSRLAPQKRAFFDQPGLGAMPGQQIRLALGDVGKLSFEGVCDTSMECASRLAQQGAVGRILHQSVFEQVTRLWWDTLTEEQAGHDQAIECCFQLRLRLTRHGGYQGVVKFPAYRPPDLSPLLGGAEPIEPRHQGSMQARGDRRRRRGNRSRSLHRFQLAPVPRHGLCHLL